MDAEKRTQNAITITREVLRKALMSPFTMIEMTWHTLGPDAVEDQVTAILCYLEKTKPKKPKKAEASRLCPNDGEELHFFSKPIPVSQLFDPNNREDCDWDGWEENKRGYLVAVCPKCDFLLGADNIQDGFGIDTIKEDLTRPRCACGDEMEEVILGNLLDCPIYICRRCHKIDAAGWKWG